MAANDPRLLLLHSDDNVLIIASNIEADESLLVEGEAAKAPQRLTLGHKIARRPIAAGETIRKYGAPIGRASAEIAKGEHVHVHNLTSNYTKTHLVE
jgi:hypothetical protein